LDSFADESPDHAAIATNVIAALTLALAIHPDRYRYLRLAELSRLCLASLARPSLRGPTAGAALDDEEVLAFLRAPAQRS